MGKQTRANQCGIERIILPVALNFQVGESGLPERFDLLPAGETITGIDGRGWSNPNPQAVVEWIQARGYDLVLDFEHASELNSPKGEPAPAAAWLHDPRVEPDGRISAAVKYWTPAGEKAVRGREYRYVSPALAINKSTGAIVGIQSVGLTHKPNLAIPALNHEQEEDSMLDIKKILKALGLPEDASEEVALNTISTLQSNLQTALNQAQTPPMEKFVPRADYELALNRATTAEAKIAQGEKDKLEGEITSVINQAVTEGKIAPASKEYYTAMCRTEGGLAQFQTFISSAPKILADSVLEGKKPGETATALNAQEKEVCRNLGIAEEDYLKTAV